MVNHCQPEHEWNNFDFLSPFYLRDVTVVSMVARSASAQAGPRLVEKRNKFSTTPGF